MSKTPKQPVSQEKDDYDQMDEMFLALNNALKEKEEELKKKESELKKREKETEDTKKRFMAALEECAARELDNEKREKELEKKAASINKNIELNLKMDVQLNKQQAELRSRALAEARKYIPEIFVAIPPDDKNNTMAMMKRLNQINSSLYQKYLRYYDSIEIALRHIYEMSMMKNDGLMCMKIAAAFYRTQFPSVSAKEIYTNTETYLTEIAAIENDELQKAIAAFKAKVLGDLKKEADKKGST